MIPMEFVKSSGTNHKLHCSCDHQFWCGGQKRPICPSCKEEWSGKFLHYYRIKFRHKAHDDDVTVMLMRAETVGHVVEELMKDSAVVIFMSSGFSVTEISRAEVATSHVPTIEKACATYVQKLREELNGQPC